MEYHWCHKTTLISFRNKYTSDLFLNSFLFPFLEQAIMHIKWIKKNSRILTIHKKLFSYLKKNNRGKQISENSQVQNQS